MKFLYNKNMSETHCRQAGLILFAGENIHPNQIRILFKSGLFYILQIIKYMRINFSGF